MKYIILLLLLLSVQAHSQTIHITISTQAYPDESIPQGWSFEGASYNSDSLEVWTSGGDLDSPLISISCTSESLRPGVIVRSISISLTADQTLILGVLRTKTFTMEIPEAGLGLPVFESGFGILR